VVSGDNLGIFVFQAADSGGAFRNSATISAIADGTPSATHVPSRLSFSTSSDAAYTERMRINSSGNVGIGISTISARTHIVSTTEQLRLGYDATKYASFTTQSDGALVLGVNGTERVRVDASGKVGIRCTPSYSLSVQSLGDAQVSLKNSSGTDVVYIGTAGVFGTAGTDDLRIRSEATNIIFGFSGAESVRFTSAGNVGINETAPDYKLDVNGTFGFTPGSSVTPVDNGDVVFELTSNTSLTIRAKGSDGTVRSVALTLA
jgi:hypothetical protein